MSDQANSNRRDFLKLIGGGVALLPLAGISGCSGDDGQPAPAAQPGRDTGPGTAPAPAETPTPAPAPTPASDLPPVAEDDATAMALGYRHDTSQVDKARFPQHDDSQLCHNCALFQAAADQEWGPCTIFPGRAVNAQGWCSAWVAKG